MINLYRLKVRRVLVKDKQKHIHFQGKQEKITSIDKRKEMLQVDGENLKKLESVNIF